VTLNFSLLPFCNWYPTFSSLPPLCRFRVIRIQGPVVSVMCQSSTKQSCAVFSFVEDDGFYKILSERRSHLSLHMFLFLSSHVYFFFFCYSIHLHHHLLFWFISNCLLHVFFCHLTEKSARSTFPNLQNFRVGVLRDLRRVFIHATPVFFDRGIANLDTKEISSVCVEPCKGESIIVTVFEIFTSEVPAFVEREHEFRFLAVTPLHKDGHPYSQQAVVCSKYSDEEYRRIRCKGKFFILVVSNLFQETHQLPCLVKF
jgi:hypothetical protein